MTSTKVGVQFQVRNDFHFPIFFNKIILNLNVVKSVAKMSIYLLRYTTPRQTLFFLCTSYSRMLDLYLQ